MRRCFGVIDRFDCLGHDAIIGRDNEHNDIGYISAARAHRGESGVAGRIDEGKCRAIVIYSVGADVLRYSTRFTRRHASLADSIHQRCLTMIYVAHECDDGTARLEFLFLLNNGRRRRDDYLFYLVNAGAFFAALFFKNKPVILRDLRRDIGFDCLVNVGEDVVSHQLSDELMRFQPKLSC